MTTFIVTQIDSCMLYKEDVLGEPLCFPYFVS